MIHAATFTWIIVFGIVSSVLFCVPGQHSNVSRTIKTVLRPLDNKLSACGSFFSSYSVSALVLRKKPSLS